MDLGHDGLSENIYQRSLGKLLLSAFVRMSLIPRGTSLPRDPQRPAHYSLVCLTGVLISRKALTAVYFWFLALISRHSPVGSLNTPTSRGQRGSPTFTRFRTADNQAAPRKKPVYLSSPVRRHR